MPKIQIKDTYRGVGDDQHMPQLQPKELEAAYRRWRQDMIFMTYGPQNKKTWDEKNRYDRWRVGQRIGSDD